ncbi:hypothetical protein AB834_03655 [PVC group bacterium (ex Bugula neritina AB1)]|nr:hypothetical protein AB834_03655 [PVC group bacterium (ex Bugula neritina AB1)]
MTSYKKILLFFINLNAHRTSYYNKKITSDYLFTRRNNKTTLNINKIINTVFLSLRLANHLTSIQNKKILIFGNSNVSKYFSLYMIIGEKNVQPNVFFLRSWIHGIISNWNYLNQTTQLYNLKRHSVFFRSSKKLRFFNIFFGFFKKEKPSLVIVFPSTKMWSVTRECVDNNIPVISISDSFSNLSSYNIVTGYKNFIIEILFLQLFLSFIK